jgi:hypothetical protein
MSRPIDAANQAEVEGSRVHAIVLAHFAFTVPVFVHSGIGNITYSGNTYLGAGNLVDIDGLEESEDIAPTQLDLTLNYVPVQHINEALDSGNYGDTVTLYLGYKNSAGQLVADPELIWRGFFEHATIKIGSENAVTVSCQHELTILDDRPGRRWTDEDQQAEFAGDTGFSFAADMPTRKLLWGGKTTQVGGGGGGAGNNTIRHHR